MNAAASRLQDLQGLRALAVMLVLVFHLWPEALTGGYVGVDVFFVLSGYLMTALLVRERERSETTNIAGFYARRIRRLVPASSVVIAAVALAAFFLPSTRWLFMGQEIIASALFLENWLLAWRSVDYLTREAEAGLLQHYWTLAVEFQFYLLWPLVIIAAAWVSRRAKLGLAVSVSIAAALITVAFFAVSAIATPLNPDRAYFATETRIWEFALGGVIAAANVRLWLPALVKAGAGVAGLIMIAMSAALFSGQTIFPGIAAALPCVGAALFIASGDGKLSFTNRIFSVKPLVWLGDISYSVYLWHWPLIVGWQAISPGSYDWRAKIFIAALSILLAYLTKLAVEDPIRGVKGTHTSYLVGGSFAGIAAALSAIPLLLFATVQTTGSNRVAIIGDPRYPGAMALSAAPADPIPALALVRADMPVANFDGCHVHQAEREVVTCTYGDPAGEFHFVLIGDSHAGMLSPAFKLIAERNGWRYTHMSKSQCPFLDAEIQFGREQRPFDECTDWNQNALETILEIDPNAVLTTQIWQVAIPGLTSRESQGLVADALMRRWSTLQAVGIDVIAIRDVPNFGIIAANCLASASPVECARPRADVEVMDQPIVSAAEQMGVPILDLTDWICEAEVCPAIVGNIVVWRDQNHLTATYVRSMVPFIEDGLASIFDSRTGGGPAIAGGTAQATGPTTALTRHEPDAPDRPVQSEP